MTNILIQRTSEFTAVRRERDGWLLGTVHYSAVLDGYTIRVLWPLGVRDTKVYRGEQDAIAAITYRQGGPHPAQAGRGAGRLYRPDRASGQDGI